MSYYKKLPVLDEKQQAEFDKYLEETYQADIRLAQKIARVTGRMYQFKADIKPEEMVEARRILRTVEKIEDFEAPPREITYQIILDKLATPRIYLLRDWIHRRQEDKARGIDSQPCVKCGRPLSEHDDRHWGIDCDKEEKSE